MNIEDKIKEFIEKNYKPENNGDGYWDTGNYDDTFQMGLESGYADALIDIAEIIGLELIPKKQLDID